MGVAIGFSLQKQYDLPVTELISMLNYQGFSAVSPLWTTDIDLALIASSVKKHNMIIQSLHASYTGIPLLWEPKNDGALSVFKNIIKSIDDCDRYGINILVIHGWAGLIYTFPSEPLAFDLFDEIVEYAEKRNVSIAFENLEGEEYLNALMSRYQSSSHIGYCWDSGHDNCYPHKLDFLKEFGDRLIMTHLNDNFGLRDEGGIPSGDDDLHLLPCDGKIDWDKVIYKLAGYKKQDMLNFELKQISISKAEKDLIYADLSTEEFIAKAGKRARLIAEKYDKYLKE